MPSASRSRRSGDLDGHVSTYAERLAAAGRERCTVKAVAIDLKVKLSGAPRDDSDLARAIAHILEWNVQVRGEDPRPGIRRVVTLDGEVESSTSGTKSSGWSATSGESQV